MSSTAAICTTSLHRTDAGLARYVAENAGVSLHAKTRGGTRQRILKVAHDQDDLQGRVYAFVDKCVRPVCGDAPRSRGLNKRIRWSWRLSTRRTAALASDRFSAALKECFLCKSREHSSKITKS